MDARTLSGWPPRAFLSPSILPFALVAVPNTLRAPPGYESGCLIKFGCWTVVQIGDDNRLLVLGVSFLLLLLFLFFFVRPRRVIRLFRENWKQNVPNKETLLSHNTYEVGSIFNLFIFLHISIHSPYCTYCWYLTVWKYANWMKFGTFGLNLTSYCNCMTFHSHFVRN